MAKKRRSTLEKLSIKATRWIGTPQSILIHTILFIGIFTLTPMFGLDRVLLIFTTALSIEAIYIGLLVQMTVASSREEIKEVAEDVEDILEDTEDLTEDAPVV